MLPIVSSSTSLERHERTEVDRIAILHDPVSLFEQTVDVYSGKCFRFGHRAPFLCWRRLRFMLSTLHQTAAVRSGHRFQIAANAGGHEVLAYQPARMRIVGGLTIPYPPALTGRRPRRRRGW